MLGTVENKGGQEPKKMSRRQFLKLGGIAAGAAVLATCVPQIKVPPTDEVKEPSSTPESQGGEALPTSTPEREEVKPTGTPEVNLEGSSGAGGSLAPGVVERLDKGEFAGQQAAVKEWMSYFTSPLRGQTQYASPTLDKVPYMLVHDHANLMEGEVAVGAQDLLNEEMMVFPPALAWRYDEGQFVGFASPADVLGSGYATSGDIPVNYGPLRISKSREAGATLPEMVGGRLAFVDRKTGFVKEMMDKSGVLEVESRVNRRPREWRQEWERADVFDRNLWPKKYQDVAKMTEYDLRTTTDVAESLHRFLDYMRVNFVSTADKRIIGVMALSEADITQIKSNLDSAKVPEINQGLVLLMAWLHKKGADGKSVNLELAGIKRLVFELTGLERDSFSTDNDIPALDKTDKAQISTFGPTGIWNWVGITDFDAMRNNYDWARSAGFENYSRKLYATLAGGGSLLAMFKDERSLLAMVGMWTKKGEHKVVPYRVLPEAIDGGKDQMVVYTRGSEFFGSWAGLEEAIGKEAKIGPTLTDGNSEAPILDQFYSYMGRYFSFDTIQQVGAYVVNGVFDGAEVMQRYQMFENKIKVVNPWEEGKVGWNDVLQEVKVFAKAMKKLASA